MRRLFYIFITVLLVSSSVRAIVVADYVTATNTPIGIWNLNWDYVYNYKVGSAVAVGSHWLLTAAHLADDSSGAAGFSNVVVNGVTYYPREIIFHAAANDPEHANKADLALVRFDKEFPGYYPLYTGSFPTGTNRLNAVMVGYGVTGTVYSSHYTAAAWSDPSKGTKRWGSQKIDQAISGLDYDIDPTTNVVMTYNDGILMGFSRSDTDYEAGVGTYDSGGGTFVNDGGTWKLAGINTFQNGAPPNFTGALGVSVPAYETWATNVMNPNGDLDGDGIPNYWEQRYGTTTGLVASADNDSDGFTNYQEYLADTNPTNSASFFAIDSLVAQADQTVTFLGSTARQYQVFCTTNDLADTNLIWFAAHTNKIWGTGTNSFITVTNTGDKAFYRLKVTLP